MRSSAPVVVAPVTITYVLSVEVVHRALQVLGVEIDSLKRGKDLLGGVLASASCSGVNPDVLSGVKCVAYMYTQCTSAHDRCQYLGVQKRILNTRLPHLPHGRLGGCDRSVTWGRVAAT